MNIETLPPDGDKGEWRIESFRVSQEESDFTRIRAIQHPEEYVPAGSYKKLTRKGAIVMSNTPMELKEHRRFIYKAEGVVLINGLGLGVCLAAILGKPEVTSVTVIEISPDVIGLVGPSFASDKRVAIIEANAFTWKPPYGQHYDVVWHDIWQDMCADNLPEMTRLKRKYGRRCDWQGCWAEAIIRYRSR